MSWDYDGDQFERFMKETLQDISKEAAKSYLGGCGDAVDRRIAACLDEAQTLLGAGHPGPALCLTATALELMIRFLLLRPLVQGAFLSDEWAEILADRIASGRTVEDRRLLPDVLRQWEVDVAAVRTPSNVVMWDFIITRLWPSRDHFVHRYEPVRPEDATIALECARTFRSVVVATVAKKLGFTLEITGCWYKIHGKETSALGGTREWRQDFTPFDPLG